MRAEGKGDRGREEGSERTHERRTTGRQKTYTRKTFCRRHGAAGSSRANLRDGNRSFGGKRVAGLKEKKTPRPTAPPLMSGRTKRTNTRNHYYYCCNPPHGPSVAAGEAEGCPAAAPAVSTHSRCRSEEGAEGKRKPRGRCADRARTVLRDLAARTWKRDLRSFVSPGAGHTPPRRLSKQRGYKQRRMTLLLHPNEEPE